MKLVCSVCVGNRLLPALAISSRQRYVKSTIALCKNPKSDEYCIIHFTTTNKNGARYAVRGNISQILTKFIKDGKATIQFKSPPHDLFVQADIIQLKSFLHLLKKVLENKIGANELTFSSMSVTGVDTKNVAPKKLVIRSRSEYPGKGFPRTLESLYINDIKRTGLDLGILKLAKLKILDLSNNIIEHLPVELSNLRLYELNLASNCFHNSTPRQWGWLDGNLSKSLKTLNLESNNLRYLPDQIVKLHNLHTFNVNNNQLKQLPQGLGNLKNLKILIASNNFLTILPGSLRNCFLQELNLFNNSFSTNFENPHPLTSTPKNLPVLSLVECAARKVLKARLPYSPDSIPFTLVRFLDHARYCVCGQACFEIFYRVPELLLMSSITQSFVTSNREVSFMPVDSYFCSSKCFRACHSTRNRYPVI